MALNHILYRPQLLERSLPPATDRIPDEALEMVSRLLADGIKGGRALEKAKEGLEEALATIIPTITARFGAASQSVDELLNPIIQAFEAIGSQFSSISTPAECMHALARLLLMLADVLENLSAEAVEALINKVLSIITEDLGLSRARMTEFINDLIDKVVQKMKEDFIAGDHSEQAHNEYLIGAYLEKLKRVAEEQIAEVDLLFDIPHLAQMLSGFLRDLDWDRIRLAAAKVLEDVGNTAESLGILFDIFSGKFTVTVEVTVEANVARGGGGGGDDFDPVSWYANYFDRKFGWTWTDGVESRETYASEEPWDTRMSFGKSSLPSETMEQLAYVSEILSSVLEAIFGFASIQKKDIAGNVTHSGLKVVRAVITTLLGFDDKASWVNFYKVYGNWWLELVGKIGVSMLTGIESSHKCTGEGQGIFWLTLVGKDLTESLLYDNWVSRIRQGILSILTLVNSDPIGKPNSENHDHVVGFTMLISELFSWILATFSGRKNFGFPAHGSAAFFWVSWFVGAPISGVLAATAGTLFGWLIAHKQQPDGTSEELTKPSDEAFGLAYAESIVASLFKHTVYNYIIWNGKTNGGKFGQDNNRPPNIVTFKGGYPEKASSPYKLPHEAESVRQCAQGNLGPWSHNANTKQIYAFDWDHDHDMEVLAVRDGTIDLWSDVMPDHTTLQDNHLNVNHDRTPPDPIHDRDHTANPVLTTSNYIHGAHFSFRHIFAAMGIPESSIKGTPVDQGMLVMFAGDTGMSFYNHLHMHVSSPNAESIPWVFSDEKAPDNGVLSDLVWYESSNARVEDPGGITVAHPQEHKSLLLYSNVSVVSSGAKKARLNFFTGVEPDGSNTYFNIENIYAGCTLVWETATDTQYLEIESHKWNDTARRVDMVFKDAWAPQPPIGATVRVQTKALATTANTIVLDSYATTHKNIYNGRFIHVWWTDSDNSTVHEYKQISGYDTGSRKVTVDSNWDRQPAKFANFEIGGLSHANSNAFYRRFSFVSDSGSPGIPAGNLMNVAVSYKGHRGRTSNLATANKVTLRAIDAPAAAADVVGRSIAIFDGPSFSLFSKVIAYARANAYNPATREVTIDGTWGRSFSSNVMDYEIGNVSHSVATAEQAIESAFICPDSNANDYTPTDFSDALAGKPYVSLTYKTW